MFDPRIGSMGLLARGRLTRAVSAASSRRCWSWSITSGVQALKNAQKLAGVASVRP